MMPSYTMDQALEEYGLYEEDGEMTGQLEAGILENRSVIISTIRPGS